MGTLFASVYNRFLGKITDDMYMELTPKDTIKDLQNLLVDAIPSFEFPRKSLDYEIAVQPYVEGFCEGFAVEPIGDNLGYDDISSFNEELTSEEINILAISMLEIWLQRQITSIENIRMKYGGTDFKMTSQASHLGKLLSLLSEVQRQSHHLQRLYKRRRPVGNNSFVSNWDVFGNINNDKIDDSYWEDL